MRSSCRCHALLTPPMAVFFQLLLVLVLVPVPVPVPVPVLLLPPSSHVLRRYFEGPRNKSSSRTLRAAGEIDPPIDGTRRR